MASSQPFGTMDWGHGRKFFPRLEGGGGLGMIQMHYIYCALYFYYCCQLHLISSGIRSQRLGTPALLDDRKCFKCFCTQKRKTFIFERVILIPLWRIGQIVGKLETRRLGKRLVQKFHTEFTHSCFSPSIH